MTAPALPPLPVPELAATLHRLRRAVEAVNPPARAEHFQRVAQSFEAGPGPQLQDALRDLAHRRAAEGSNWMAPEWLRSYLTTRGPLPATTNVAFELSFPGREAGLPRIARVLDALVQVHRAADAGQLGTVRDGRGNPLDPRQLAALRGGSRRPRDGADHYEPAAPESGPRQVGIISRGALWTVPVPDHAGPAYWERALRLVIEETSAWTSDDDFLLPSYLDAESARRVLDRLEDHPANARGWAQLRDLLFTFTVMDDEDGAAAPAGSGEGSTGVDSASLLRTLAFRSGLVWANRPLSYAASAATGWCGVHVEHSTIDGGTLVDAMRLVSERLGAAPASTTTGGEEEEEAPRPARVQWRWPQAASPKPLLEEAAAGYRQQAGRLRVDALRVPLPSVAGLPVKLSQDALAQALLARAQQRAFGCVRGTYESVDMRTYQAGRTEALRPVTPELARWAETGKWEHLVAASDAHREWVKACKTGCGMDRHLWLLELLSVGAVCGAEASATPADELTEADAAVAAEFFAHPALAAVRRDFLSTTSLGALAPVGRYAFAPTVSEGFGVNYTPVAGTAERGGAELCVTWREGEADHPERFLQELRRAGEELVALASAVASGASAPA